MLAEVLCLFILQNVMQSTGKSFYCFNFYIIQCYFIQCNLFSSLRPQKEHAQTMQA